MDLDLPLNEILIPFRRLETTEPVDEFKVCDSFLLTNHLKSIKQFLAKDFVGAWEGSIEDELEVLLVNDVFICCLENIQVKSD